MKLICSNLACHPDISFRYKTVQHLIEETNAPIQLIAIERNHKCFIGLYEGRKWVFTFGNTFKNLLPHWKGDRDGIRKECTVDEIYPNFVKVEKIKNQKNLKQSAS